MNGRRWRRGVLLAVATVWTLATPTNMFAHGALKRSVPAANAHLAVAPRTIRLDFTESVELPFTSVTLVGADGSNVALDAPHSAPDSRRAVIAGIRGALAAGTYTVRWKMAGADGHPVHGSFAFVIASGATGLQAGARPERGPHGERAGGVIAPGQAPPPASHHDGAFTPASAGFDAESPAFVAIRWAQFMAMLVLIGAVAFHFGVLGALGRRPRSPLLLPASLLADVRSRIAALALGASVALAGTVLLRLAAQSYAMHGVEDVWNPGLVGAMLVKTIWGWGWLLQAFSASVAMWGFARARRAHRDGWRIAVLGVLALAFTPALSGHAVSTPRFTALAVLSDGVHVLGAGGWLGSLLMLTAAGLPAAMRRPAGERGPAVADLVNAFSPTALIFASATAVTGVFAAWLHLGAVAALWQTGYGRVLLVKLGVLSVTAGTGAYNWLRVKPTLVGPDGERLLRRSARVELAVGVLVLLVTAILVGTPTAMDASVSASRVSASVP